MEYDAIIIGAGVGGLSAALKLSREGKRVLLLEAQAIPGGYASSFKRKGFTFESSVHCVDALGPEQEVREFLEEMGVAQRVEFIKLEKFCRLIYPEHDFTADCSRDNLLKLLQEKFPQEKDNLERFFSAVDKFGRQFVSYSDSKLPELLKLLLAPILYLSIINTSIWTTEQFFNRYLKDEKLKGLLTDIWRFMGLPPSKLSAFYFLVLFRSYYLHPTAYIKGGFAKLFNVMIDEIKDSGSEVKFNSKVKRIATQNGRVRGVITDKNEMFNTKTVISNANPIDTLTGLLDDKVLKEEYGKKLGAMEKSISGLQVYLGLSSPAKSLGMEHYLASVNNGYNQEGAYYDCLSGNYDLCALELVDHAQLDPRLAPEAKGTLVIMTLDNYSNWSGLSAAEYEARKKEVATKFIERAERYLPGLSRCIEVTELATPLTMKRYTGSPDGAIYGFAQSVNQSSINRLSQKTKVKGLFLAGGWTFPGGGVHACFLSGKEAASLALKFLR